MGKWPLVRLGDVCEFIRNGASIQQDNSKKGFPITRIETISNGEFDRNKMGYAGIYDLGKYGDYVLKTGDILLSHINSVSHLGKSAYYENISNEIIIHGMNLLCLRLKKEQVNYKYGFYYFNSPFFKRQIPKITKKSVNQASFTVTALKGLQFILPTLNVQKHIADTLDKTQEIIDSYKKQLAELDNLIKSVFYEMFGDPVANEKGWKTKPCKKLTTKVGSGATPKGGNKSYKPSGISLIRSLNVHNGFFKYDGLAFIDETQADDLKNVSVERNDVLLNITGASVARCCIVPDDVLPARVNQHVAIVRPKKDILNHVFLNHLLINDSYQQKLLKLATGSGATREALTKQQIESLDIISPPLDLQNKFANIVTKIEEQKALVKQAITESEHLFKSLMSEYFD